MKKLTKEELEVVIAFLESRLKHYEQFGYCVELNMIDTLIGDARENYGIERFSK